MCLYIFPSSAHLLNCPDFFSDLVYLACTWQRKFQSFYFWPDDKLENSICVLIVSMFCFSSNNYSKITMKGMTALAEELLCIHLTQIWHSHWVREATQGQFYLWICHVAGRNSLILPFIFHGNSFCQVLMFLNTQKNLHKFISITQWHFVD